MTNINKIKPYLVVFLLLTIVYVNYSIIVNSHYHLDEKDGIIFHSHPYSKENGGSPLSPKHNHTKLDLFFLAQIINILSLFLIFLFIIYLFVLTKKRCYYNHNPNILLFGFFLIPQYRGPPDFHRFI